MTQDARNSAWEESYRRGENHVYSPADEIVRFVSRYLRRRVGLDEVVDVYPGAENARVIDAGCGIGRNLIFGHGMGLDMHGVDLSVNAVEMARSWFTQVHGAGPGDKIVSGDIRTLPWSDGYFDHAMSDSALDSMPMDICRAGIAEIARVVKSGGYFYCNLISGDRTGYAADFSGEEVVSSTHEKDTIQLYFNRALIEDSFGAHFEILRCELHKIEDVLNDRWSGRWHVTMRRR